MPKNYSRKNKRHRSRGKKGGDIESGTVENVTPMSTIPPDPNRFENFNKQMLKDSYKPISNKSATSFFEGPTPEQKQRSEQSMMTGEDPLNKPPFDREDLKIFNDVGGRRKSRRKSKRKSRRHKKRRVSRRR